MKKVLFVFLSLFVVLQMAQAQRMIKGTVTDKSGSPVIGANVVAKGTTTGTITDLNGNYSLNVPEGVSTVVISYTGYNTQEIALGASNMVDVSMEEGVLLNETVITALGVKRNKSDVVYANQTVSSEELNTVTNKSVLNALQGKVAGVKIGSASGAVGASTRIVLRGETSLTQGNNALIVVDGVPVNNSNADGGGGTGKLGDRDNYVDFGNRANDINPDDIESVTVLKGPAATTLYGSRGGSGVILVTTKKGKESTKPKISFTTSFSRERAYLIFKQQQRWGSGYKTCGGCGGGIDIFMGENFSWGAELDGRILPWTGAAADEHGDLIPLNNGKIEQLTRPYSAVEDNLQNFFDDGQTLRNNISISGGSDKYSYFLSYTNFNNSGIVPNTNLHKNNILLNVSAKFTKKLNTSFSFNYSKLNQRGATEGGYPFGYSSGTPAYGFALQTPVNIPFHELRDYNSPYHDFKGFYGQYSINPYFILDQQVVRNSVDNVIANVEVNYLAAKYLTLTGRVSTNFFISSVTENNPKFAYERTLSWSDGVLSDFNSPREASSLGSYKESAIRNTNIIYDLQANYSRPIGDNFKINATLGFNSIEESLREVRGATIGGLVIPGFYDLTNSAETPKSTNKSTKYRLFGLLFNTNIGYKDWLYLEYSARQDYSSTLPDGKRDFFYQAVGLSIVPTNRPNWGVDAISYLKIRGSIGSAGKDAPLYRLESYYSLNPTVLDWGDDYRILFPFNGVPGAQRLNRIGNPDLKPELSITNEVGLDLGLFKDRLVLEYTYYIINSKNQIVDVNIPWSTGFSVIPQNIGRMENKGHEIALRVNPVRNSLINWNVFGTYSKNDNIVKTILENDANDDELNIYQSLVHFAGHGTLNLVAIEGQPFGTFKGTGFVYDPQGRIVVDGVGNPKRSDELQLLGSYQPDFLYSFGTNISIKGFTLSALFDGKEGGLFYSGTKLSTEFNGTASTTALHNRESFVVENSVFNNNGVFETNTTETNSYAYHRGLPAAAYLLDASYLKLREVSLSYSLPKDFLGTSGFSNITIGVFAKNLKYWVAKENTFADPEVGGVGASSDAVGIETSTTPTSRSFGAEIKLTF
jgi:TonB-linked SusC/RagA family outer membrane protein